jgi:hypothetical protein
MTRLTKIKITNACSSFLVTVDGQAAGLVQKFWNTPTEEHPWKAFSGVGLASQYVGAFYPSDGGKSAAVRAVVALANEAGIRLARLDPHWTA